MTTQLKDEELIRQQLSTNPTACFEALYSRYVSKVYRRCLSMTKNEETAQDYTHDIFIRTFARLDRFEERATFSTWLYSISFNYCLDQIKLANRLAVTTLDDMLANQYADTHDDGAREERLNQLTVAMSQLTPREATLLRMKYQQELDIRQIASQLQLSESAVKMRLKRTREKVRQFYTEAP